VIDSKSLKCHNVATALWKSQMKMGVSKWNAWSFSSDMSDHCCAVVRRQALATTSNLKIHSHIIQFVSPFKTFIQWHFFPNFCLFVALNFFLIILQPSLERPEARRGLRSVKSFVLSLGRWTNTLVLGSPQASNLKVDKNNMPTASN